jgi:hypothetical protein
VAEAWASWATARSEWDDQTSPLHARYSAGNVVSSTTKISLSHRLDRSVICVFCEMHPRASTDSHTHGHRSPSHRVAAARPVASGTTVRCHSSDRALRQQAGSEAQRTQRSSRFSLRPFWAVDVQACPRDGVCASTQMPNESRSLGSNLREELAGM